MEWIIHIKKHLINRLTYYRYPLIAAFVVYIMQLFIINGKVRSLIDFSAHSMLYVFSILAISGIFGYSFYAVFFSFLFQLKKGNRTLLLYTRYFLTYFFIMLFFLLLVWPGIFKGDEFYVLRGSLSLTFSPAQSGITSLFYIVCILFFPSMATITFFQLVFICMIFSYIMYHLMELYHSRFVWLLLVPALLLPVIDGNLFTLRSTMVGWLFLALIFDLFFLFQKKKVSLRHLLGLSLICGLIIAWRSEFFYLILLLPLSLLFWKLIRPKHAFILVFVLIISFSLWNVPNKIASAGCNKYPISLVLNPLANLFTQDDLKGPCVYDDVMVINELVDVKLLRQSASVRNISQYWNIPDQIPAEQLSRFMKSSLRIIAYNFDDFLRYRMQTFAYTNGFFPDRINHPGGEGVDSINKLIYYGSDYKELFAFSHPLLSQRAREKTISLLACRVYKAETIHTNALLPVFYNCVPPFILLFAVFIISCFKKKKEFATLSLITGLQIILIFLTAPAMFFMYYFCFYLCSYALVVLFIIHILCCTKKNKVANSSIEE